VTAPGDRLRAAIDAAARDLARISAADSARPPAPGRWSPREVIGHLIDSAANNHGRFVRALATDELVFPGYAQDEWVASQRYADAPWDDLLTLWTAYNRHLARVLDAAPADALTRPRARHNLHEIAFRAPPAGAATLGWFAEDYVEHLEHHVRQVLGGAWTAGQ
jgi:hypothetical protein